MNNRGKYEYTEIGKSNLIAQVEDTECCFEWVRNLVADITGGKEAEGV
jgi:hypothetical protein